MQERHLWTGSCTCFWPPTLTSLQNTAQAESHCLPPAPQEPGKTVKMSDMEDDFMCDDEEDYDLVLKTEFILRVFTHMSLEHSS